MNNCSAQIINTTSNIINECEYRCEDDYNNINYECFCKCIEKYNNYNNDSNDVNITYIMGQILVCFLLFVSCLCFMCYVCLPMKYEPKNNKYIINTVDIPPNYHSMDTTKDTCKDTYKILEPPSYQSVVIELD